MVPSLGRFRPPVACKGRGGNILPFCCCCNFVFKEVWFLFSLQMLGDLNWSFDNNLLLDSKASGLTDLAVYLEYVPAWA